MCLGMRYFLCNSVHFVIDIDECTENSHNCSHECINTIGSYVCDCNIGYQLDDTLLQCVGMHFWYWFIKCEFYCDLNIVDIDECAVESNGGCDHNCTNTEGSYYCSCFIGYELDEDQKGCSGQYMYALSKLLIAFTKFSVLWHTCIWRY